MQKSGFRPNFNQPILAEHHNKKSQSGKPQEFLQLKINNNKTPNDSFKVP
jgi:hypothetical protein